MDKNGWADTAKMIEQVKRGPSVTLSFYYNDNAAQVTNIRKATKVEVMLNRPLLVFGNSTRKNQHGN